MKTLDTCDSTSKQTILTDLMALGTSDTGQIESNTNFTGLQELDGFEIAFLRNDLLQTLCEEHGFDPADSEAFIMRATQASVPHVHEKGESILTSLGQEHGFPDSQGGTYIGKVEAQNQTIELELIETAPGEVLEIRAGDAHFFTTDGGPEFVAVGFVSPRIQNDSGFDISHFETNDIQYTDDGRATLVQAA